MKTTKRLLSSESAEEARRRLMLTYASYRGWRAADFVGRPRLSRLRLESTWRPSSPGVAISQLVATAEHFSAALLIDNAETELTGTPHVAQELWRQQQNRVDSTWDSQASAWKSFFSIDFQADSYYPSLLPFIDARNSVAHGLGTLTRRQLRDRTKTVRTLTEGGFRVKGNTVTMSDTNVSSCRDAALNFILWLDFEDQRRQVMNG